MRLFWTVSNFTTNNVHSVWVFLYDAVENMYPLLRGCVCVSKDSVEMSLWCHWNLTWPTFVWQLDISSKQIRFWHGPHRQQFQLLKLLNYLRLSVRAPFSFFSHVSFAIIAKECACLSWTSPHLEPAWPHHSSERVKMLMRIPPKALRG